MYRFEVFKGGWRKRLWFFRFVSANNEIVFGSEGYTRKESAEDAITIIKLYAKDAEVVNDG